MATQCKHNTGRYFNHAMRGECCNGCGTYLQFRGLGLPTKQTQGGLVIDPARHVVNDTVDMSIAITLEP